MPAKLEVALGGLRSAAQWRFSLLAGKGICGGWASGHFADVRRVMLAPARVSGNRSDNCSDPSHSDSRPRAHGAARTV